jgi:acyl carrier protein
MGFATQPRVLDIVADVVGRNVEPAMPLDELSADSLTLLEVIAALEDAGMRVAPPEALSSFQTVGDLLEVVSPIP